MESIGLFYNKNLDVLFGISNLDFDLTTKRTKVIQENLVLFLNEKNVITNFNLFAPQKYLQCTLYNGINSDNLELRKTLKTFFENNGLQFTVYQDFSFIVGEITKINSHPDASNLLICEVSIKTKMLQIICGAKNCAVNNLVVVASEGTIMPNGKIIAHSKLRGIDSYGMLCSEKELGLADNNPMKEIIILQPKKYSIGESFWGQYYEQN